jgi:hypothetical protein
MKMVFILNTSQVRGGSRKSERGGSKKLLLNPKGGPMASEASKIQLGVLEGAVSPPENSTFFMTVEVI